MGNPVAALAAAERNPGTAGSDPWATPAGEPPGYGPLLAALAVGLAIDAEASRLVDEAAALWTRPGFETFVSLPRLRFEPFDYQLRAAERVLRQMRGRAILADEVGLGKTIEAGLVISELRLRGLAGRSLVVVPSGLVTQWREELERKFALPSVIATGADWRFPGSPGEQPVVVVSLAAARRAPLRDALAAGPWDVVVIDEAHRVRRTRSASGRLARLLRSRYLLLLTATPVENRLDDLYQLVSLVRPGHLGTSQEFRDRHAQGARGASAPRPDQGARGASAPRPDQGARGASAPRPDQGARGASAPRPDQGARGASAPRSDQGARGASAPRWDQGVRAAGPIRDLPALRARTREVMVRHRRSEVARMLPRRLARTRTVAPAGDEAALYAAVSERVRRDGRGAPPSRALQLRAVQRLAGSSPRAAAPTLERIGWCDLATRARGITSSAKARALVSLLCRHRDRGEKVLVFSGFRETLRLLAEASADAGIRAVVYHGGLGRCDKDAVVEAFRDEAPVLLATEAAGEGRNLQFCHTMVNFDLPWNPMQIEQRLGRLHRIGQDHEVTLTNLVTSGTIEQRILDVLEAKVNLFELVVGELDMILGRVDEDFDFEHAVFDAHVSSVDDGELAGRLDVLGDALAHARAAYLDSRGRVDALAGEPP